MNLGLRPTHLKRETIVCWRTACLSLSLCHVISLSLSLSVSLSRCFLAKLTDPTCMARTGYSHHKLFYLFGVLAVGCFVLWLALACQSDRTTTHKWCRSCFVTSGNNGIVCQIDQLYVHGTDRVQSLQAFLFVWHACCAVLCVVAGTGAVVVPPECVRVRQYTGHT
jgi:phosphatidylglycerophosphate synthase